MHLALVPAGRRAARCRWRSLASGLAEHGERPRGARQAADLSGGRSAERSGLAERGVRAGIASAGGRASVLSSVSGGAHLSIPLPIPL